MFLLVNLFRKRLMTDGLLSLSLSLSLRDVNTRLCALDTESILFSVPQVCVCVCVRVCVRVCVHKLCNLRKRVSSCHGHGSQTSKSSGRVCMAIVRFPRISSKCLRQPYTRPGKSVYVIPDFFPALDGIREGISIWPYTPIKLVIALEFGLSRGSIFSSEPLIESPNPTLDPPLNGRSLYFTRPHFDTVIDLSFYMIDNSYFI